MRTLKSTLLSAVALFLGGCTTQVEINPNIFPTALTGEKYGGTVAIFLDPELVNYEETASDPSGLNTFNLKVGDSLTATLPRTVEAAYQNAIVTDQMVSKGEYERVIKFGILNFETHLITNRGFWVTTFKASAILTIRVEAYDGETMELIRRSAITGQGTATQGESKQTYPFGAATEKAIRQVSNDVANLFVGGFGEHKF